MSKSGRTSNAKPSFLCPIKISHRSTHTSAEKRRMKETGARTQSRMHERERENESQNFFISKRNPIVASRIKSTYRYALASSRTERGMHRDFCSARSHFFARAHPRTKRKENEILRRAWQSCARDRPWESLTCHCNLERELRAIHSPRSERASATKWIRTYETPFIPFLATLTSYTLRRLLRTLILLLPLYIFP